jgi:hypothetical protein
MLNPHPCKGCKAEFDGGPDCTNCQERKRYERNRRERLARKAKKEVYESLGMVKVRGSLGGTYWE